MRLLQDLPASTWDRTLSAALSPDSQAPLDLLPGPPADADSDVPGTDAPMTDGEAGDQQGEEATEDWSVGEAVKADDERADHSADDAGPIDDTADDGDGLWY